MWNGGKEGKKKNLGGSRRERMGMIDTDKAMAEIKTLENPDTLSELSCSQQKNKLLPCSTTAFSMLLWVIMKTSY